MPRRRGRLRRPAGRVHGAGAGTLRGSLNGNHDLAVTGEIDARASPRRRARRSTGPARTPRRRRWSSSRGLAPEGEHEGFGLFHASPRDPIWEYVLSIDQAEAGLDAQAERIWLVGHSHVALFFTRAGHAGPGAATPRRPGRPTAHLLDLDRGEWLLNPGSVGQPRDGDRAPPGWSSTPTSGPRGTTGSHTTRSRRGRRSSRRVCRRRSPSACRSAAERDRDPKKSP